MTAFVNNALSVSFFNNKIPRPFKKVIRSSIDSNPKKRCSSSSICLLFIILTLKMFVFQLVFDSRRS